MTVLSGAELRRRLSSNDTTDRLVVSPLLDVEEQVKPDQASIDVRLGFEFAFVTPSSFGVVDELTNENVGSRVVAFSKLYEREYLPFGCGLAIHPHQFLLATTLEYIRLPRDLMAYVVGRSTWGRLGLIVATAIGVHPRFAGTLTLELRNLGEAPLMLYPGQTIAQLFFHTVEIGKEQPADTGQYIGAVDLIPKALSSESTFKKLHALKREKTKS
jgi:dCTP deaminase